MPPCYGKSIVYIVDDQYSSKKIPCKLCKFTVTFHKLIGKAYCTILPGQRRIHPYIPAAYSRERKKCSASELILLQKSNKALCRLLIVSYNILDSSA